MSKKIFAANWKLNKTPDETRSFIVQFKNEIFKFSNFFENNEVLIFPQAFSLEAVASLCAQTKIGYGPQNVYSESSGAFTGENSVEIAKQMQSQFVLVGHSERRALFDESDELLNKKSLLVEKADMTSVFCIGETLSQRESGQTWDICSEQLKKGLSGLDKNRRIIIAYEPVWAIGTGKVASTEQVAEVHLAINQYMSRHMFLNYQILYGGSVKTENARELLAVKHVDGFLIGGASLQVESFVKICTIVT